MGALCKCTVQSCHAAIFQNPSRDGRCRHHLSSVKTSSPGKWGDTTGIPLALQQTAQCIKRKRRQIYVHVAQPASLESSPPRPTAPKRPPKDSLVSLATEKHHQERAFKLALRLVYIRTCTEPCANQDGDAWYGRCDGQVFWIYRKHC